MSINEPITIRSYIDKNLTSLNWNILPQIFESEGVELTEEIERYLRETPKNTNWNVLGQMSESGDDLIIDAIKTFVAKAPDTLGYSFSTEEVNYLLNELQVGESYSLSVGEYEMSGIWSYQQVTTPLGTTFNSYQLVSSSGSLIQNFGISISQSSISGGIGISGEEQESYRVVLKKLN